MILFIILRCIWTVLLVCSFKYSRSCVHNWWWYSLISINLFCFTFHGNYAMCTHVYVLLLYTYHILYFISVQRQSTSYVVSWPNLKQHTNFLLVLLIRNFLMCIAQPNQLQTFYFSLMLSNRPNLNRSFPSFYINIYITNITAVLLSP